MMLRRYHNNGVVEQTATPEVKETSNNDLMKQEINSLKLVELKIKAKELELETTAKSTADELKALIIEKLGL